MFGNLSRSEAENRRRIDTKTSRLLRKEVLLSKMEAIDSDNTPSEDSSVSTGSNTSPSSNSESSFSDNNSEDSIKKLEKNLKRRKKMALKRRELRLAREEELRKREELLNSLEKEKSSNTQGKSFNLTGGLLEDGASGVNNSDPSAIDHVAEILRALKGKGKFTGVLPSSPDTGVVSKEAPPATPSSERRKELRNKFKSAVRKTTSITRFNKVSDEGVSKRRRQGINLSNNLDSLSQVGNLVYTMHNKLEREKDRKNMSGLAKFLSDDVSKARHDDFDSGVNAMALLCALVLSVPYQVAGTLAYDNLDWMKDQIDECVDGFWTYEVVYTGYRLTFIMTVYFSISGMIIATFFFLFKRNNDFDFKIWRSKARYMVVLLFLCTALSIIALILLTNLYFDYYLLSTNDNICDSDTLPYVLGGCSLALVSFIGSFYLIL